MFSEDCGCWIFGASEIVGDFVRDSIRVSGQITKVKSPKNYLRSKRRTFEPSTARTRMFASRTTTGQLFRILRARRIFLKSEIIWSSLVPAAAIRSCIR
jgi:hypothetical protein